MADNSDLIAAFLAKGGKVTKVDSEVRTLDARAVYKAVRGEKSENDLIEERHIVCGGVQNGLGEWIASD